MLKHYLTIVGRQLRKNKLYSLINLLGLTAGMTVAILLALWVGDELSWDKGHEHYRRLAQVMDTQFINGELSTSEANAIPLSEELRKQYSEDFKRVAMFYPLFTHTVTVDDRKISAPGSWVQADLPEMLTLHMLRGSRDALRDPANVLLTRSLAHSLFGDADPIDKIIKLDNMATVKVGGVYEDLPDNSSFHDARLLLSWEKAQTVMGWFKGVQTDWGIRYWKLYVELNDNVDIDKASAKIRNIMNEHTKGDARETLMLHPMEKWHLYSEFSNGISVGGRIRIVRLLGIIGGFVLLLACINFMNLSTARSEKRAREVGIRKAIGSLRGQLIAQFLGESMLFVLTAGVLAVVAAALCMPFFNLMTDKQLSLPVGNIFFWTGMLLFVVLTGLVAGSYPAFYLSGFRPVAVLKGNREYRRLRTRRSVSKQLRRSSFHMGRAASWPRKILVVVQFAVSVTLIISTVMVRRQVEYAKDRPVGYLRDGLIAVTMNSGDIYGIPYNTLRDELRKTGVVADMTKCNSRATEAPSTMSGFFWKGKDPNTNPEIGVVATTYDYGSTMGWHVAEGRDFSRDFATDSSAIVLNKSAVRMMGLQHPVGEIIRVDGRPLTVIGVTDDMVMASPYKPVEPTVFWLAHDPTGLDAMVVRLAPGAPVHKALAAAEEVFKRLAPGGAFEYKFIDEEYARKFSDEVRIGRIVTVFALLAIFISCLGLFGLVSFVAEQRTKEIGVRKVLGARVMSIWMLLTKEFIILVSVSCVIAIPAAWYFLHGWLQQYEYRAVLGWWVFAAGALGAMLITLATVSYQAVRAASVNPVKSLKTE